MVEGADAPFFHLGDPELLYAPDVLPPDVPHSGYRNPHGRERVRHQVGPGPSRPQGRSRRRPSSPQRHRAREEETSYDSGPRGGEGRGQDRDRRRHPSFPEGLFRAGEDDHGDDDDEGFGIILDEPPFEVRPTRGRGSRRPPRPSRRRPGDGESDPDGGPRKRPRKRPQSPPRHRHRHRLRGGHRRPLPPTEQFVEDEETIEYIDDPDYDVNYDVAHVDIHDHEVGVEIDPHRYVRTT